MATGSGPDLTAASPFLVTDGLQHSVEAAWGAGWVSLSVDGERARVGRDSMQPGLPGPANVFLGGEPGGQRRGFRGCISAFQVRVFLLTAGRPACSVRLCAPIMFCHHL